jgi:hypothetical protein
MRYEVTNAKEDKRAKNTDQLVFGLTAAKW